MKRFFQSLLAVLAAATERQLARYVQFLEAENRMLRGRLPKRLVVTPQERRRLLKLGQPLGLALREVITIVSYPTFLRWVREATVGILIGYLRSCKYILSEAAEPLVVIA